MGPKIGHVGPPYGGIGLAKGRPPHPVSRDPHIFFSTAFSGDGDRCRPATLSCRSRPDGRSSVFAGAQTGGRWWSLVNQPGGLSRGVPPNVNEAP